MSATGISGNALGIGIFALLYVAIAALVKNSYYQLILTNVAIWATLAVAWNIFSGYSGLVSFGHAAFFGLGAFTVTLLTVHFGLTPWLGLPIAAAVGAVSAIVIGIPTFRLRGHYFALAMLAYPLALLYVFEWLGYQEVTLPMRRDAGLKYMQFDNPFVYTVLAVAILSLGLAIATWVERSRFGLILQSIKQNEPAAQAAGIDPARWKLAALVVSGALSALVGGFNAVVLLVVTPREVFGMLVSASALIFTMFGATGTVWGPVLGAAILVPLSETLHAELSHIVPGIQGVIYGLAILLVAKWLPEGVYWRLRDGVLRRVRWLAMGPSRLLPAAKPPSRIERLEATGPAALSLQGLSCRFGGLQALDNVAFDVRPASITGVVGPNGAGKTTLFNVINGFVSGNGSVRLGSDDLTTLPPHLRCRLGIGRTFQVPRVFARLTVFDNVLPAALATVHDRSAAGAAAAWAVKLCGLEVVAQAAAGGVPAIQTRLIEIARALAGGPRVLLLDETLAGLSASEIEFVVQLIRRIRDLGVTVVIIEHTMSAMVALVDRMVVLDRGVVIADGSPGTVVREPRVVQAYLGSKWGCRA